MLLSTRKARLSVIRISLFLAAITLSASPVCLARHHRSANPQSLNPIDFGADPKGIKDSTSAFQAAVDASEKASGCTIFVPSGNYLFHGTVKVTGNGVQILGSSRQGTQLNFDNGSADDFTFISPKGQAQIANFKIADLYIDHPMGKKTGGNVIKMQNVAEVLIDNINIDHSWNGMSFENANTVEIRATVINCTTRGAQYGIKLYSPPDNVHRSDAFTMYDCTVYAGNQTADGMVVDGAAYTIRMFGVALLNCGYGLHVQNTAHSTNQYPQFFMCDDLECDGPRICGVMIEAGSDFKFVNCDIDATMFTGKTGDAMTILPDIQYSHTHSVHISNCRIGNAVGRAAYIEARDVQLANTIFDDASKAGVGVYPAVELGPKAECVTISGGQFGAAYGNERRTSYGLVIDPGARRITVMGINTANNVTGDILNKSLEPSIVINGCIGGDDDRPIIIPSTPKI